MHIDEALKRVKKIEKKQSLANEMLRLIIDNGSFQRVIVVPLNRPTRKY